MGAIVEFIIWLKNLVAKALEWFLEIPSKIVLFVTTFVTVVSSAITYIVSHFSDVANAFDSASSKVSDIGSLLSKHQVGSLFAYVTSLDIAAQYTVSVTGLFLGFVGILFITLFSYVITMWVVPMALLVAQKTISLFTAGFVKT